ncbi:ADP-ribose pyrophosphatase [Clostridium cavendishii DSM 21758]|uniref:ADP-ribose pyrophosphatase n=1 Tax=Clostridium cavendishii DSM 21758 TaxID=1121302 RepID=A0A1M6E8C3_9CLOT|nr:NUDIX hydrolase [Clostridium cavendishii]SHI81712.1 ADP-ribose pyrophosphatase [Clostridium cavendishii DSM 21758]
MKKPKIKKVETLAETKFLKLYDAEYENKNGDVRHWSIASRKDLVTVKAQYFNGLKENIDAVIIVAVHEEFNKLVIIKQFRVPLNNYVYELPAGLIDDGEDFETTVKRELKEETGLDLVSIDMKRTKKQVYISTGMTDESVALVYCTCKGETSDENLEADEDIEVILASKEEAKKIIDSNEKIDIKALLAIQNFIYS